VPVITTEGVIFTVGGEPRSLPAGEIWEINNTREHSVENTSDRDRVHLIVDWVVQ
jgi:quercetin dioxygenase-like cupin family protein